MYPSTTFEFTAGAAITVCLKCERLVGCWSIPAQVGWCTDGGEADSCLPLTLTLWLGFLIALRHWGFQVRDCSLFPIP
ncbi:hypothetical protein RchiOBHm_Chr3g0492311 [Rosa chinensis]|uniref:Uncharacterized protein n=1 Tax=Rosa chinensis TaxID=74649 RepID=A0A2P6RGF8_ROSCH|nr:hypothetical protein RchiOBHm_Chr3g0492311 [Rosa chinensis]